MDKLKESIVNHLTLRYDPNSTPAIKPKTYQDFLPKFSDENGRLLEWSLKVIIEKVLKPFDVIILPLSGGVDSSLVLALTRSVFPDKNIITLHHYGVVDESEQARRLSKKFNTQHIEIRSNTIVEDIPKMIKISGEPRWNVYHFKLFEEIREILDPIDKPIMITGDGGDELFGGYVFRYKKFLENIHESKDVYNYINCHSNDFVPEQYGIFNDMVGHFNFYSKLEPFFDNILHPLDKVMLADFNGKLIYDFLPVANKLSKHYDIPIFAPLLETHEFSTHLPIHEKIYLDDKNITGKIVLRNILDRLEVPTSEKKTGYSLDIMSNYKENEDFLGKILLDKTRKIYKYINYDWVDECFGIDTDYQHVNKWLQLYALDCWLNQ